MLLDLIQDVVTEFKSKLITGMMIAPIYQMDDAIIQKISDQLPLKRWSAVTSAVCKWTHRAYWKGRPAQMLLSMHKPTSWYAGNFNEIAEHHWQYGRMKIIQPHELTTAEAQMHAMTCQLPRSYVFEPRFTGHTGPRVTTEQLCWDHLAWLQNVNRYDFQYYVFGEKVRNLDMFNGSDSLSPMVEVNEVMLQAQNMGEFGRIDNPQYLAIASPLMEHIFLDASPPSRQDHIRTATYHEARDRAHVLWDARRRSPPMFATDDDELNVYVDSRAQGNAHLDADLAFAQRLQESIDQKDAVIYSKRMSQMQRDAEYAQSLVDRRHTRATSTQQQMSSVNDREHLQTILDIVAPISVTEDSEEDEQPIEPNQLEELNEVIYGQPYQPDQYSQANITFHNSSQEVPPVDNPGENTDSD